LYRGTPDAKPRAEGHYARKNRKKTRIIEADAACLLDHANRQFSAGRPNAVWVADYTYVKTWQGSEVEDSSTVYAAVHLTSR
jgi:transposase InsO family protein